MTRRPDPWPRLRDVLRPRSPERPNGFDVIDVDDHQPAPTDATTVFEQALPDTGEPETLRSGLADVIDLNPTAVLPVAVDEVGCDAGLHGDRR